MAKQATAVYPGKTGTGFRARIVYDVRAFAGERGEYMPCLQMLQDMDAVIKSIDLAESGDFKILASVPRE